MATKRKLRTVLYQAAKLQHDNNIDSDNSPFSCDSIRKVDVGLRAAETAAPSDLLKMYEYWFCPNPTGFNSLGWWPLPGDWKHEGPDGEFDPNHRVIALLLMREIIQTEL